MQLISLLFRVLFREITFDSNYSFKNQVVVFLSLEAIFHHNGVKENSISLAALPTFDHFLAFMKILGGVTSPISTSLGIALFCPNGESYCNISNFIRCSQEQTNIVLGERGCASRGDG